MPMTAKIAPHCTTSNSLAHIKIYKIVCYTKVLELAQNKKKIPPIPTPTNHIDEIASLIFERFHAFLGLAHTFTNGLHDLLQRNGLNMSDRRHQPPATSHSTTQLHQTHRSPHQPRTWL